MSPCQLRAQVCRECHHSRFRQMLQRAASKRNRRLRGEPHFTPRLMFAQPGIIYEKTQTGGDGYTSMISISDWITFPPHRKLYAEEFSPVLCPPVSYLSAPSIVCLTLICPACIIGRSQRSPYFTHNNLRVRTEENHREL